MYRPKEHLERSETWLSKRGGGAASFSTQLGVFFRIFCETVQKLVKMFTQHNVRPAYATAGAPNGRQLAASNQLLHVER